MPFTPAKMAAINLTPTNLPYRLPLRENIYLKCLVHTDLLIRVQKRNCGSDICVGEPSFKTVHSSDLERKGREAVYCKYIKYIKT